MKQITSQIASACLARPTNPRLAGLNETFSDFDITGPYSKVENRPELAAMGLCGLVLRVSRLNHMLCQATPGPLGPAKVGHPEGWWLAERQPVLGPRSSILCNVSARPT
jgi:hypothetical protein